MNKVPDFTSFFARTRPDRLVCVDLASGRRWDYRAFDQAIARAVAVLEAQLLLKPGDRLAVLGKNSAEFVILHLACLRAGVIYVPLNWRCSPAELDAILIDCDPAALVASREFALASPCVRMDTSDLAAAIAGAAPKASPAPLDGERPAVLLYTSGTTGTPKGAILTASNLYFSALNFVALGAVNERSVFLCEAPMFHVIGLVASLHSPLVCGGTMLISDGFEPGRTIGLMADSRLAVTHYFCVPQMAARLLAHAEFAPDKFAGLVALFTGGAPHPARAINAWLDRGIAVVDGFGMTETGTLLGMPIDIDCIRAKAGSCGVAAPHVEVRIVADDGRDAGEHRPGELWVRGPNITSGYWNRPEQSAASFAGDGWFRTGDVAEMDADGYITMVGRMKDMYISGGENIYAGEVETRLLQHPAIAEAAIIGRPDEKWGEVGHAYLVARKSTTLPSDGDLARFCEAALARFKVPQKFFWLPELPRTASGKVNKRYLPPQP
jgi:fatty-acyl-CoA synthase